MTAVDFTEAKACGYKVVYDVVDNVFRALSPDGGLIAEQSADTTTASRMWQLAIEHYQQRGF